MSIREVARIYTVNIPDDRKAYQTLIDAMLDDDPDVSTGNYGNPDPKWLEEMLIIWLTYQYDKGNYTDIIEVENDNSYEAGEEQ